MSDRFQRVFEKLTLPLRSRAHLRDYGSHEHPMLRHRSQRPGSPRTCRQPGRGWAAHARPTCAPSLTRSFTCCEPVASGACYPASSCARAPFTITFVPGKMRARPMKIEWARQLRDQCKAASIPFFMKQTSGRIPGKVPIPPDLMIREFPKYTSRIRARACAIPRRFTNSGGS